MSAAGDGSAGVRGDWRLPTPDSCPTIKHCWRQSIVENWGGRPPKKAVPAFAALRLRNLGDVAQARRTDGFFVAAEMQNADGMRWNAAEERHQGGRGIPRGAKDELWWGERMSRQRAGRDSDAGPSRGLTILALGAPVERWMITQVMNETGPNGRTVRWPFEIQAGGRGWAALSGGARTGLRVGGRWRNAGIGAGRFVEIAICRGGDRGCSIRLRDENMKKKVVIGNLAADGSESKRGPEISGVCANWILDCDAGAGARPFTFVVIYVVGLFGQVARRI